MKFTATLKPTALTKKARRICPEYQIDVEACDKNAAALAARKAADAEGFLGYAITKIQELRA